MTDLSLTEWVLAWITSYGAPMVGLILLVAALGVPLPGTLLVIASGAFVKLGLLNLWWAAAAGFLGAVLGDCLSYAVGYFAGKRIERRFAATDGWVNAQRTFTRFGGLAVYLTRFLLTPLALVTNLVAGASSYRFWRFLTFDLLGELTWILLYGGIGYLFGSQWQTISDVASNFSGLFVGIAVLAAGLYLWRRRSARSRITQLQQTTPAD